MALEEIRFLFLATSPAGGADVGFHAGEVRQNRANARPGDEHLVLRKPQRGPSCQLASRESPSRLFARRSPHRRPAVTASLYSWRTDPARCSGVRFLRAVGRCTSAAVRLQLRFPAVFPVSAATVAELEPRPAPRERNLHVEAKAVCRQGDGMKGGAPRRSMAAYMEPGSSHREHSLALLIPERPNSYEDQINQVPDPQSAQGQQHQDTGSDFPNVKPVDSKYPQQNAEEQSHQPRLRGDVRYLLRHRLLHSRAAPVQEPQTEENYV